MQPVIQVRGLGKRYQLGVEHHSLLRNLIAHKARGLVSLLAGARRAKREEFWALRDLDFSVNQGDVVGIVGRNGAGKSTLLKILSRITEPTTGRIEIEGRVASLLEVGTGFHPELSGRDNIFLNGAILGMTRREIISRFDEIVAFAEVERFIDTPVKHYSSGMYVRLAFAVAAHLEPEILIVDEVLSVGDSRFQEKCLGKIRSITGKSDKTVLLVSHNLSVVMSLCNKALLLQQGRLLLYGDAQKVAGEYLKDGGGCGWRRTAPLPARCGLLNASVESLQGNEETSVRIEVEIEAKTATECALEMILSNASGQPVAFGALGGMFPSTQLRLSPGRTRVGFRFDTRPLANGRYLVSLKLAIPFVEALDEAPHCISFEQERPPTREESYVLQQSWNAGAFMLHLTPCEPKTDAR